MVSNINKTNEELLNDDAKALGYTGPAMSSVDALTWLVGNRQGPASTLSNAQLIAEDRTRLDRIESTGKYRGVHDSLSVANTVVLDKKDGDYVLIGNESGRYELYINENDTWELGFKSTITIVKTAASLPDLTRENTGALFFVKDESTMYLFDGSNYHAASTPTIIDGYQLNLVLA
ncbi:MAG: hypothetical protein KAH01_01565 [Caldisericia bacterium]|nr:hypothetical protein [Caldisericia bacterium]